MRNVAEDILIDCTARSSGVLVDTLLRVRAPLPPWLRLLWDVPPTLVHLESSTAEENSPFLTEGGIFLPSPPLAPLRSEAREWYLGATAHAAAHVRYSRTAFARDGTAPITQALLGLFEDARVEALAIRELPGLQRLWASLHCVRPEEGDGFETLLLRLARTLVDPAYIDLHPWIRKAAASFASSFDELGHPQAMRVLASSLGHDLGQTRMAFNARMYRPGPSYRDDNRWMWHGHAGESKQPKSLETGAKLNQSAAKETASSAPLWHFPEWDYRIGRLRTAWCAVRQRQPIPDDVRRLPIRGELNENSAARRVLAAHLRRSAKGERALQRRAYDGDDIDLDEAICASIRSTDFSPYDMRVYTRSARRSQRVAVIILIDCSASTAQPFVGDLQARMSEQRTQLDIQKSTAHHFAEAMEAAGWTFAIQGFDSDGRHCVNHWRVKDFSDSWNAAAASRLAGLRSGLSTRLGAALRHATFSLEKRSEARRLVLAMSDGESHDIDIHDPRYLRDDARHAVRAARRTGVEMFALVPDPCGHAAIKSLFGPRRYAPMSDAPIPPSVIAAIWP